MNYNLINGPTTTVSDYLQGLDVNELLELFYSSKEYKLLLPGLRKKVEAELNRRQYDQKLAA